MKSIKLFSFKRHLVLGGLIFFIGLSEAFAKSGGINIPVRMGLLLGYQSATNYFDENTKESNYFSPSVGADFSVPIPTLKFALGIQGWIGFPGKTGESSAHAMYLVSLYGKYLGPGYDLYLGPAFASASSRLDKTDADPNKKIDYNTSTIPCGVAGARTYIGKNVSAGIGITGFYCTSGKYNKTIVDASDVSTKSEVEKKTSLYGGLLYLFVEWNEERALF